MERPGELMTIKAFAEAAGRSPQAIYKQISTRLAPYIHEKNGQKYIERRALNEVFKTGVVQPIQPGNAPKSSELNNVEQPLNETMRATISLLQDQIRIKDQQIANQGQQINAQAAQLQQTTEALVQVTTSLQAAQALHAGTIQQQLTSGAVPQQEAPAAPQQPETVDAAADQDEAAAEKDLKPATYRKKIRKLEDDLAMTQKELEGAREASKYYREENGKLKIEIGQYKSRAEAAEAKVAEAAESAQRVEQAEAKATEAAEAAQRAETAEKRVKDLEKDLEAVQSRLEDLTEVGAFDRIFRWGSILDDVSR